MDIRSEKLQPGLCYHIFNRGINGTPIFLENRNYHYFLNRYINFVSPFVETFAYCLLKNHFHLLIRVKEESEIDKAIKKIKRKDHFWHVSNGFSSFFQSYAQTVNREYGRTGSLFESPFKRILVSSDEYFTTLVAYIHRNPQQHGLAHDFSRYPHSSYLIHLNNVNSWLNRKEILSWFGSKAEYERFHAQYLWHVDLPTLLME